MCEVSNERTIGVISAIVHVLKIGCRCPIARPNWLFDDDL
jgi:hypothetical protein